MTELSRTAHFVERGPIPRDEAGCSNYLSTLEMRGSPERSEGREKERGLPCVPDTVRYFSGQSFI